MKKIGMILGMMVVGIAAFAKPAVPVDTIPQASKDFIAKNFAERVATYAEAGNKSWEVVLDDGTEIEFYATGEWSEIESYTNIPASVLPEAVAKQIATTAKDEAVVKVAKKRGTYGVKLANKVYLRISENGTLLEQRNGGEQRRRAPVATKPVQPCPRPQPFGNMKPQAKPHTKPMPGKPDASSGATNRPQATPQRGNIQPIGNVFWK